MSLTGQQRSDLTRVHEISKVLRQDCIDDMTRFEGIPFTGRNVSEMFGNQRAAIDALAGMVDKMANIIEEVLGEPAGETDSGVGEGTRSPS